MSTVTTVRLRAYRAQTFCLKPARRVKTKEAAIAFVNERGFTYFWPIQGVTLPSLWTAVAGDRPVANAHDDPGHITWGWKDSLLGERKWFYAKLLRGKATLVSLAAAPYFYALSENFGDYAHDYLSLYDEGRLTADARAIFEALLQKGPLHTVALRKEARMTSRESNTRFEKALVELQSGLKVVPVGVAQAGAWRYSFIYDIVDRFFPDLAASAGPIGRAEARQHLLRLYLESVGAATAREALKLFQWTPEELRRAGADLAARGEAVALAAVADQTSEGWGLPSLAR